MQDDKAGSRTTLSDDEIARSDPDLCEHGWSRLHPQPCPECEDGKPKSVQMESDRSDSTAGIVHQEQHPIWDSRRLWSLWDMINCNLAGLADFLRRVGEERAQASAKLQTLAHIRRDKSVAETTPFEAYTIAPGEVSRLNQLLDSGVQLCIEHGLPSAYDRIERFQKRLAGPIPRPLDLEVEARVLHEALENDLRKKHFYRYPQEKAQLLSVHMQKPPESTTLDEWARETAQMIIRGLLREEAWELPGDADEQITTRRLVEALKDAVNARLGT